MLKPDELLARMGPGWPERLGLRAAEAGDAELFCWWAACLLRAGERREERVTAALETLRASGALSPGKLAAAGSALVDGLEAAGLREPEALAARLSRAAQALDEGFGGSLERLAGGGSSLEELGGRLVSLGPGFGPGTALRFLRPLRDRWPAADEAPLDAAAHAAAVHMGWLDAYDDLETAPGTLRRMLADAGASAPLPAVEDALERLGRRACRRANTSRCPLGGDCPARE